MPTSSGPRSRHVAIVAPHGRDANVAKDLLVAADLPCVVLQSLADLCQLLSEGVGSVLITEEVLQGPDLATLQARLSEQPAWSDLPFIVLTNGGRATRTAAELDRIDALGNALLLSRPLHGDEIVRAVRSALKARSRQYEVRTRMRELQEREADLRESEQKFLAIANSVDQMIWSTRPDGFHDYYNDRWYEFTGVPTGSTDGEAWNGMFHPDDQDRAWSEWRQSIVSGDPYQIEYRLRHRSGQYRWVLGRAQASRDAEGRITRWYGSCTDIHEQVLAREALTKSREELETAVHDRTVELADLYTKAPVALHSLDAAERLVSVSDRWLAFMGYDHRDEVIGRKITNFIAAETLDVHEQSYRRDLFEKGIVEDLPYICIKKNSEKADVLVSARLTKAADGSVYRIMSSVVDVTERKRAEAARDQAEAALRQSQKLETIGQLTGGVAHDFNNLLMAIRSSLELLERRLSKDDTRSLDFLENAIKATERGAGLTQRMLAFARRQELDASSVDVGSLLNGTRDLLERSLGPQVEIVYRILPDAIHAHVDANQLELALLNLCVNGRDAMDGIGTLTIELQRVTLGKSDDLGAGDYVSIAIVDAGTGMDAATMEQAMEPFFTTKGVGRGTGLGLSMVYGFASQSGGTLRLSSRVGHGTRAELLLPATEAPEESTIRVTRKDLAPDLKEQPTTVLAVDDDALVLMGTAGLLEDLGYDVLEASSGKKALDLLNARPDIDLVVTDHAMPKMTGVQLAKTIHDQRPDLPVILASGYAEMPEGGEKHIAVRLEKPFSDTRLAQAIEQAFQKVGLTSYPYDL